jgi:hypothetical protein
MNIIVINKNNYKINFRSTLLKEFVNINWKKPLTRYLKYIQISKLTSNNIKQLKFFIFKCIEICNNNNNNNIIKDIKNLDYITINENFIPR